MADGEWFVNSQGQVWGPYPLATLREHVSSGRVRRHTLVCKDRKTWVPAEEVPGLFEGVPAEKPRGRLAFLVKRLVLTGLALGSLGLLGYGGWWLWRETGGAGPEVPSTAPDLSTPEAAARSLMEFQTRRELALASFQAERLEADVKVIEELKPLLADEREVLKDFEKRKKRTEAFRTNAKALADFKIDVVEARDQQGMKQVKLKLTGKKLVQEGEEWNLADRSEERSFVMTQIEGKWKAR